MNIYICMYICIHIYILRVACSAIAYSVLCFAIREPGQGGLPAIDKVVHTPEQAVLITVDAAINKQPMSHTSTYTYMI